jgi:hypothetical protein
MNRIDAKLELAHESLDRREPAGSGFSRSHRHQVVDAPYW